MYFITQYKYLLFINKYNTNFMTFMYEIMKINPDSYGM